MIQKKKKRRRSSSKYEGGHGIGESGIFHQPGWRQDPGGEESRVLSRCRGSQDPSHGDQRKETGGDPVPETAEDVGLVSLQGFAAVGVLGCVFVA